MVNCKKPMWNKRHWSLLKYSELFLWISEPANWWRCKWKWIEDTKEKIYLTKSWKFSKEGMFEIPKMKFSRFALLISKPAFYNSAWCILCPLTVYLFVYSSRDCKVRSWRGHQSSKAGKKSAFVLKNFIFDNFTAPWETCYICTT